MRLYIYIYIYWVFIVETRKNNHLFDFGGTCTLYSQTINRLISLSSSVKGAGFERKRRGGFERRSGGDAVEEERRRLGGPAVETGEGLGSENS